ncbi:PDZ domain-containing protein [Chloroflexales bacterium ZM16-3]|nr:PDZ domain-containing protein [Chloroflexales bacterium ZM16-3]
MNHLSRAIVLTLTALALVACEISPRAATVTTAVPVPSATAAPVLSPEPTLAIAAPPTTAARPSTARPARPLAPTQVVEPLNPTPTLVPLSANQRERIFENIWETVHDHYLYADFRGVDWQATREEYAPKVAAAATSAEFYGLMRQMIDSLGDDHSRFESPQDVAEQDAEFSGKLRYGGIGAEIRDVDEGGLVSSVVPGGPAERAGIRPRDVITSINSIPYINDEAFGPDGPISQVRGQPGTGVRLGIISPGQDERVVIVIREVIDLDAFNRVSARRIDGGTIGLVTIPSFYVEAVDIHVRDAVVGLLAKGPLEGLVIDVRSNSGGYVHLMRSTIALFHDGGSIGRTSGRDSGDSEEQRIPGGKTIVGMDGVPIVVLTSAETVSAAEMFAAGMQVLGRAQIVGLPSAGNTENLYTYDFEDGSRVLLAEVAYRLPDGTLIEGRGVIPDRTVKAEWWRYAPDDDPQIIAAIQAIRSP